VLLFAGFVATSLLLILVYDAITQSPYFEAQRITVKGNRRLSERTILQQTNLKLHDNILSVNVSAIRSKILVNPWIASVDVNRELPDAIHIQVKEHVPIAIIDFDEPRYINEDGEIFNAVVSSDKADLPVVTGLKSDLDPDDPWRSRLYKAVMEALRLSRSYSDMTTLHAVDRIHVDKEMGLTLHVSFPQSNACVPADFASLFSVEPDPSQQKRPDPVEIKIGHGGYASKYERLRYIVSLLSREGSPLGLESIDLNDVDRVVVKRAPSGQGGKRSVVHRGYGWKSQGKEV
jgi:cell division septal protein FtsQ